MEPKKNPKYDVHQKRGIIFNCSLIISFLIVITAFEWSIELPASKEDHTSTNYEQAQLPFIPVIREKQKESPPKTLRETVSKPSVAAINLQEVANTQKVENPPEGGLDQNSPMIELPFGSVDIPAEDPDTTEFVIVEDMPEPVGGWEKFFKTLQKHMKYPRQAARMQVAGKVFVGFTVNKKGELENFSIERGIGYGCDEEAQRVIALTKWNPGKQRGRPVRVRLVQPVMFSISNQ